MAVPESSPLAGWPPHRSRLHAWGQTAETCVHDDEAAIPLIQRVGIVTVYPTSSEVANLFHAHMGDPEAKTDSKWDSPSGRVYTWRWTLGRRDVAFYGTVVRKRPTFVTWALLPAILRLVADLSTPDELYDFGVISGDAYRIAQALDEAGEPVGTSEIRKRAGFPTGSDQSAAYHRGLAELENRLVVTTEFPSGALDGTKHHALMFVRRRADMERAERMTREEAMDGFLRAYLPAASYLLPSVLAKHLRVAEADVCSGLQRLKAEGLVITATAPARRAACYLLANSTAQD